MQFNIVSVSGGTFKNDEGKDFDYGSVMVIDEEIVKREGFAGQDVKKIKCNPDLIHHIKDLVPNLFECNIDVVGKDSRVKIVSAKLIQTKVK